MPLSPYSSAASLYSLELNRGVSLRLICQFYSRNSTNTISSHTVVGAYINTMKTTFPFKFWFLTRFFNYKFSSKQISLFPFNNINIKSLKWKLTIKYVLLLHTGWSARRCSALNKKIDFKKIDFWKYDDFLAYVTPRVHGFLQKISANIEFWKNWIFSVCYLWGI